MASRTVEMKVVLLVDQKVVTRVDLMAGAKAARSVGKTAFQLADGMVALTVVLTADTKVDRTVDLSAAQMVGWLAVQKADMMVVQRAAQMVA